MMIELRRNGIFHRLYYFTYDRYPGDNFCPFFWKLVIAAALFPVTWLSFPVDADGVSERLRKSVTAWFLMAVLALLIGGTITNPWIIVWLFGGLLALAILLGLLAAWDEGLFRGAWDGAVGSREIVQIARTKKAALVDKYCPKIEWK